MRPRAERSGRNMARQSRQANARDQDRQHMPRHTEKAHETLGLTGETQIVALADFHGRFDNHHQPWWVWALTGQARFKPAECKNYFHACGYDPHGEVNST